MAKFVGKTFESLNLMLSNSGFFTNLQEKTSNKILPWVDSKSFMKKLRDADSKQSEDEVVNSYLSAVQKRLSEPDVTNAEISEMIKMCMTCEALGYSTSFIYVHCLKLAQKGNLSEKHTGYSAAAFFLHPNHELVLLLINTIQKDLSSSNYMEVLFALSSVCCLINFETVHNVVHLVEEKLTHEKSSVRKSAIFTLAHCLNLIDSPSAYQMCVPKLEKALTDNQLEVVSAAVSILYQIIQKLSCDFTYLIKSLVDLQDQILLRRVPRSMVYCDIPAPWLQLDILKLLNYLCKQPEHFEIVTVILKKTLLQVGLLNTLAHAIMFQVIETITSLQPSSELVEMVLSSVSDFLKSKNINLKFTGVEALVVVVKRLKPTITVAQQEIIMECLRLPDETLQIKTLELLFYLANPSNVQAICKKFMEFIGLSTNDDRKKTLALKILHLAMLHTDKHEWFVSISLSVFKETGSVIPSSTVNDVINIMLKDQSLQSVAKKMCIDMCRQGTSLTPCIVKVTASVFTKVQEFEEFLTVLLNVDDEEAITWLLVSLTEVILKGKEVSSTLISLLRSIDLKDYSSEVLKQLLTICENLPNSKDYNSEDEMDPSLTCMDSYVLESLESGAPCYLPASFRLPGTVLDGSSTNFKAESLSCSELSLGQTSGTSAVQSPSYSEFSSPSTSFQSLNYEKDTVSLPSAIIRNVWTSEGRKAATIKEAASDAEESLVEKPVQEDMRDLFAGLS